MKEWIEALLMVAGAGFMLVAAIGVVRFPDLYTRMHAHAKAGTVGVGLLVTSAAVHFADASLTLHALVVIAFFFTTTPAAIHRLARAAYLAGVPLWKETRRDELRERHEAGERGADLESPRGD